MSTTFACDTCFDTHTIDQGGREVACPDCQARTVTVKLTGLAHGIGTYGKRYATATAWSSSTITFMSTPALIRHDVAAVRAQAVRHAHTLGEYGRTNVSSWAIAIERRVLAAL